MTSEEKTFRLKNDVAELDDLKENVRDYCRPLEMSRKELFQVLLALEEIFVNIVSYGFTDDEEHVIEFCLGRENDKLVIKILDDGVPFNPLEAEPPDINCPIEDSRVGGLGLHLTRHMAGEINYDRVDEKNSLVIKKNLGPE